jgi:hypothetical membrane protein
MKILGSAITGFAAIFLVTGCLLLGARKPGYSHLKNTISELGEVGARDQQLVAFGLFLPIGLLLLLVALLVFPSSRPASALALCIAVGYLGAAAFPCDPGSPASGSWRQSVHNMCGGVEYIGGAFGLFILAEHSGPYFEVAGSVVIAVALAMTLLSTSRLRGLIQRIAEFFLFGSLIVAA